MTTQHEHTSGVPVADVVIITGMSGAGRSTVAKALEDLDWFVIDNLPPSLLPTMVSLTRLAEGALPRIAAVMDVRSRAFSTDLLPTIRELADRGLRPRVVFLEAADDALVRRFDSVRRPHPLQEQGRVLDGIAAERELLRGVRGEADLVVDTSALNVHELRARIREHFGTPHVATPRVRVMSFGYKYGLPVDADVVADCRFLPNPRWVDALAPLTGQDERIRKYVLDQPAAAGFLDGYVAALRVTFDGYRTEGKQDVTLAVGCTGGKHRSVVMAEEIASRLHDTDLPIQVVHRDLGRE
ncbi:MAG TPA: RNase adapter RapZ [Streptosporangiaceae bacterium]|nr:RNase adapter RapZ [Streptosporangiaceae bacterium]